MVFFLYNYLINSFCFKVNNHLIETNVRKKNEKKSIVFKDKTPFFSNSASIILKKRELPPKISANAENNNIAKVYPKNLTSKEERSYKSPIIENFRPTNFLNNMMLILKAARKLIFRSRFRNIKGLKDIQLDLIGDSVFFHEREKKNYFLKRYIEANVYIIYFSII